MSDFLVGPDGHLYKSIKGIKVKLKTFKADNGKKYLKSRLRDAKRSKLRGRGLFSVSLVVGQRHMHISCGYRLLLVLFTGFFPEAIAPASLDLSLA